MALSGQFHKPFAEQWEFFRQKLNLPVADWRDMPGAYNDLGFFASGFMKADLIADLRAAVAAVIAEGKSIGWFRDNFDAIVERTGWAKPGTKWGEPSYRDWRARIIYQTNVSTSYAAGRWQQLNDPGLLARAPYWMYRHSEAVANPRPWHLAWDRVVKLASDTWWLTHFCPNGFGCKCYIIAVSEADAKRLGGKFGPAAGEGQTYRVIDRKSGEVFDLPVGIDRGWDYAPGALAGNLRTQAIAGEKMESWDRAIALRFAEALRESPAWLTFFARSRGLADEIAAAIGGTIDSTARKRLRAYMAELPAERDIWPIAAMSAADQAAIGTERAVVYLTRTNLAEHLVTHANVGAADYRLIQRIMDAGELYTRADGELTYLAPAPEAGSEYRLGIQSVKFEGWKEVYVATLFTDTAAANTRQIRDSAKYRRIR